MPPTTSDSSSTPDPLRSDESFRMLVESVKDYAVFMLDPDGLVRSWNRGAELLKGWRADEIVGRSFTTFYTEDDRLAGRPAALLRQAEADGRVEDQGWRVRKDGSRFFARVVLTALRDEHGRLAGFGKVTNDVTEAMTQAERELKAERAARESQDSFRLLVESVRDHAIFMIDVDGRVATWNAGAERLKGYTAAEIIGKPFSIFYGPDDLAAGKPASELVCATRDGRVEDQGWRVRKDGSRFFARVVITALRDASGALRGFAKVTNDVTASYLAAERVLHVVNEAATLLQTEDYRTRLETVARLAVPELADCCVVDVLVEGALERTAVVHRDPARAELMLQLKARPPGSLHPELTAGAAIVVANVRELSSVGWFGPDPGDLLRPLELQSCACLPLLGREGLLGAITFCSTVAGHYHEHDLVWLRAFARTAASALESALLLEEVQRAAREAQDAVAVRDAFLSVAAHELRTPLNTLNLMIQGFVRAARKTADEASKGRLERVQEQLDRLTGLITALLDVSRIAAGRLMLEPTEFDLCELVRELLTRDEELVVRAGCELRLELPSEPLLGRWDRLRVDQAITNLLTNALKFGAGKPIRVAVGAALDRAHVTVEDQGVGIALADQERIFQRFERAVSPRSFGGLGLGLWIVRQMIEAHGGAVRLESAPGQGARFTLELPRSAPAAVDQLALQ